MVNQKIAKRNIMADQNHLSENEEMYLITVRRICESCDDSVVPISELAEGLSVLPVSVNQMVKKLANSGFLVYTPYKGVELTARGKAITNRILRHRRLWEVFLVKHLEMQLDAADSLACRLEHLTSEDVADRLSKFLDNPVVCFHGSPIYPAENQVEGKLGFALSEAEVGKPFQVQRVVGDEHTRTFLAEQGLYPGSSGSVIAINSSGSTLLEITPDIHITASKQVCEQVLVIYREL